MPNTTNTKMYVIQDVPGKGKGFIASQKIPMGTRILCEEPLITFPETGNEADIKATIASQVNALPNNQREIFLSIPNIHPYKTDSERYFGIVRTVSLPIENANGQNPAEAIFLEACRINHACDNNAQKGWNAHIQRFTIHALRDIEKDEEITVYYLGKVTKRETRQAVLKERFRFLCTCRLCSLPPDESQESDNRLEDILRLDRTIEQGGLKGIVSRPLQTLRYVEQIVQLYKEDNPHDAGLPRAYIDAAQIFIANGDLTRGKVMMERAVAGWVVSGGDDCTQVKENKPFINEPSKHPLFGYNDTWRTAIVDIPTGLSEDDFEDWLWRRDKPKTITPSGTVSPLRDRTSFPRFQELPDDKGIDPRYFGQPNEEGVYEQTRHWCFLGEIVNHFTERRLQLELKDVAGRTGHLISVTVQLEGDIGAALFKTGHTVAVLYAKRHHWKMGPLESIILEQADKLKASPTASLLCPSTLTKYVQIFPVSLDALLTLSDEFKDLASLPEGTRMCHGCGKKGTSMQRCGRCLTFWYCSKACQETGWKNKGHTNTCRLVNDADFRGLIKLNSAEFRGKVRFPLGISAS
ncbi:hypothetical protein GE09DRAFT_973903 [Coniochaeta sp. 2T2.1]|nr:hypothetical protein GE09DRAFT_973903 [Coniochaeta sp. 2T2.1]